MEKDKSKIKGFQPVADWRLYPLSYGPTLIEQSHLLVSNVTRVLHTSKANNEESLHAV